MSLKDEFELPEWLRWAQEPKFDARDTRVREYLSNHHEIILASIAATAQEDCLFEGVGGRSLAGRSVLDEDAYMPTIARILIADGRLQAADGNWNACWERFRAVRRLASHLAHERDVDRQYWIGNIEHARTYALEAVFGETSRKMTFGSDDFPIQIQEHTYRAALSRALKNTHAGMAEHIAGLVVLDPEAFIAIGRAPPSSRLLLASDAPYLRVFFYRDEFAFADEQVRRLTTLLDAPSIESLDQIPEPNDPWPLSLFGTRKLHRILPFYGTTVISAFHNDSYAALADVALACEGFDARHGDYPQSPGQLIPDFLDRLPSDPFGGELVRFRIDGDGLIIYMSGVNGKDDRGVPDVISEQIEADSSLDIPFCLGQSYVERRLLPPEPDRQKVQRQYPRYD